MLTALQINHNGNTQWLGARVGELPFGNQTSTLSYRITIALILDHTPFYLPYMTHARSPKPLQYLEFVLQRATKREPQAKNTNDRALGFDTICRLLHVHGIPPHRYYFPFWSYVVKLFRG